MQKTMATRTDEKDAQINSSFDHPDSETSHGVDPSGNKHNQGEQLLQDILKEDMGWQEIRQKYINAYCDTVNVQTKSGMKQVKVMQKSFCCFGTTKDGYKCQDGKGMTCAVYAGGVRA